MSGQSPASQAPGSGPMSPMPSGRAIQLRMRGALCILSAFDVLELRGRRCIRSMPSSCLAACSAQTSAQLCEWKAGYKHFLCGTLHKVSRGAIAERWHAPETQMLSCVSPCRCIAPQHHVPCAFFASGCVTQ